MYIECESVVANIGGWRTRRVFFSVCTCGMCGSRLQKKKEKACVRAPGTVLRGTRACVQDYCYSPRRQ